MIRFSLLSGLRQVRHVTLVAFTLMSSFTIAEENKSIMSLRTLYKTAVIERGDAINIAMARVEAILEREPDDIVARVYKGSLLTLMGGDVFLPWNKLRYVNGGIDLMDDAIGATHRAVNHGMDAAVEILMVAAFTNSRLPRMFKRDSIARQQIAELIAHRAFDTLDGDLQSQALEIAAGYAKADGDRSKSTELFARAAGLKDTATGKKLQ